MVKVLGLPAGSAAALARLRPVLQPNRTIVISEKFTRWYTRARALEREFYWPNYKDYLRQKRNWAETALDSLDLATDEVMERLADPLDPQPRRGLVVGHVQSGKTANYTGVIAKAIDQGYRLIIVLAGMQEPLGDRRSVVSTWNSSASRISSLICPNSRPETIQRANTSTTLLGTKDCFRIFVEKSRGQKSSIDVALDRFQSFRGRFATSQGDGRFPSDLRQIRAVRRTGTHCRREEEQIRSSSTSYDR